MPWRTTQNGIAASDDSGHIVIPSAIGAAAHRMSFYADPMYRERVRLRSARIHIAARPWAIDFNRLVLLVPLLRSRRS